MVDWKNTGTLVVQYCRANWSNKHLFIFKYQDPDPYSEYRSGSRRPSNRNPKHWVTGTVSKKMKSLWLVENNNDLMMEFYADK